MAGVILDNISRVYPGGVRAVDGVSLEVRDREFLVLVGPSGCGKTTTLRLIAGLERPCGGRIAIGTRTVNDVPAKDRDVAMVFQNYALYPHLTVYRNLAFGLELRETTGRLGRLWKRVLLPGRQAANGPDRHGSIAARVDQAARLLGIERLLERLPAELSGGEKQRVALGRAIVRDPAVFLFDEPLSNLDARLRLEMREELRKLHAQLRATMIYVTHDQEEALTLGDRIVVMNEGRIQQVGPPRELHDWPANRFVAGFLGTPAMNFIAGEFASDDRGGAFRRGDWSVSLAERELAGGKSGPSTLGVRPRDARFEQCVDSSGGGEAVVRSVEWLGGPTVVVAELIDKPAEGVCEKHKERANCVVVEMEPGQAARVGDRGVIRVDARRVHLFDPQTGDNWVRRAARAE